MYLVCVLACACLCFFVWVCLCVPVCACVGCCACMCACVHACRCVCVRVQYSTEYRNPLYNDRHTVFVPLNSLHTSDRILWPGPSHEDLQGEEPLTVLLPGPGPWKPLLHSRRRQEDANVKGRLENHWKEHRLMSGERPCHCELLRSM